MYTKGEWRKYSIHQNGRRIEAAKMMLEEALAKAEGK